MTLPNFANKNTFLLSHWLKVLNRAEVRTDACPTCPISPHQVHPGTYHLTNLHPNPGMLCPYAVILLINQATLWYSK